MGSEISDSDACARGNPFAIGAFNANTSGTTSESARSDGVGNSRRKAVQTTHKTTHKKPRACRCGKPCTGTATRCKKCEPAYRKGKRAKAKVLTIDVEVHVIVRADKTFGVLVTTSRIEGDEASRGKLYGPYETRKEAQAKAALVDQALEVWGFANGW